MANSTANQISVGLQESLNLNTNKAEIKEFVGFNKRNSPFINGGISPIFKAEKTGSVIDKDGNVYTYENREFKKNGITVYTIDESRYQNKLVRTKIDVPENCLYTQDKYGQPVYFDLTYKRLHYGESVKTYNFDETKGKYFLQSAGDKIVFMYIPNTTGTQSVCIWFYATLDPNQYVIQGAKEIDLSNTDWRFEDIRYIRCFSGSQNGTQEGTTLTFDCLFIQPGLKGLDANSIGDVSKIFKPVVAFKTQAIIGMQSITSYVVINEKYLPSQLSASGYYFVNPNFATGSFTYMYSLNLSYSNGTASYTFSPKGTVTLSNVVENNNFVLCDQNRFIVNGICKVDNKPLTMTIDSSYLYPDLNSSGGTYLLFGEGCGAPNEEGKYNSFAHNSKYHIFNGPDATLWGVLYNNNNISGLSFNRTLITPWLDVDSNFVPVYQVNTSNNSNIASFYEGFMIYKSSADNCYYKIESVSTTETPMALVEGSYIIFNTVDYWNGYDIKSGRLIHVCDDWNNRATLGNKTATVPFETPVEIASSINSNYELTLDPVVSAIFNPLVLYGAAKNEKTTFAPIWYVDDVQRKGKRVKIDCYASFETATTPSYSCSITLENVLYTIYVGYASQNVFFKDELLSGVNYPVSTDGNIILSPSLFSTFFDSEIGADYIKDGRYYNLIYYEGIPLLAYYYGSGVANSEARFVIQGQSFIIRNGLIYSTTYNNGLMTVNDAIVNVDDLQFIGCVPMAAFFFSPATKCVLAFTGDRNLQTSFEATEMESVLTYKYVANNNSLYLATPSAVYVLYNTADGSSYIYKIDIADVSDFVALNDGSVALKVGTTWNILSFFEKENFETIPVKLTTCFYGAGLNRVSVIDCWYIRLFSNTAKKGKVKVKVETMTNISMSSEEQTFEISKEKWDENNNYIYLRYQPKLQRSVGCSLSIESDFAVYNLQCSVKPDSTIQVTKENGI